jgi:hypothetical protein
MSRDFRTEVRVVITLPFEPRAVLPASGLSASSSARRRFSEAPRFPVISSSRCPVLPFGHLLPSLCFARTEFGLAFHWLTASAASLREVP